MIIYSSTLIIYTIRIIRKSNKIKRVRRFPFIFLRVKKCFLSLKYYCYSYYFIIIKKENVSSKVKKEIVHVMYL